MATLGVSTLGWKLWGPPVGVRESSIGVVSVCTAVSLRGVGLGAYGEGTDRAPKRDADDGCCV